MESSKKNKENNLESSEKQRKGKEETMNEIESILFMYGKPVKTKKLKQLLNLKEEEIKKTISKLEKRHNESNNSSLKVISYKDAHMLTVKEKYSTLVRKVTDEYDLPKSVVETLSIIALNYPMKQSNLISLRNNKAYDHLKYLEEIGLIHRIKEGRTYIINLSKNFFDYFDIDENEFKQRFRDNKEHSEKNKELRELIQKEAELNSEKSNPEKNE